jgi:sulfite exporter TauE/SafE
MVSSLLQGTLLGLATGHICLASCGPVYLPYLAQQKRGGLGSLRIVLEISAGRFISYAAFGLLAGMFGTRIAQDNRTLLTAAAYILLSVYLLVSAFRSHRCERGCASLRSQRFTEWPVLLGIVTGINFCPSFLIALIKAVDLSGAMAGLLLFTGFFAGTTLFLIPFSLIGFLGAKRYFRTIARVASVIVAVWFFGVAVHSIAGPLIGDRRPIVSLMGNEPLQILAENRSRASRIAAVFTRKRSGPVHIVTTPEQLPQKGFILTEEQMWKNSNKNPRILVGPGRFVALLPPVSSEDDLESTSEAAAAFLSHYWFRLNRKKGSFYTIPIESAGTTQPVIIQTTPLPVRKLP